MKNAAQKKKISTANPSRPSTPPNNTAVMSPDDMEDLTNRVIERVASRMERRMEEIFNKITTKEPRGSGYNQQLQPTVEKKSVALGGQTQKDQYRREDTLTSIPSLIMTIPKIDYNLFKGPDNPELSITEDRNKRTLTLNHWLSAWNKFTAIICTKNPELGSVIPHHIESILEMSREGGNWQYYDIQFRKLLERGEAQWGCTHLKLYLRAKLQVNVKSGNDNNKSGNTRWPIGDRKKLSPENDVYYNSKGNTPVKVDRLAYWLKGYKIKMYNYLVKGFKYGFDVGFRGSVHHNTVDNLLSAKTKPDIVRQKIQNEISANRFVGPFDSKPFTEMQLSPLGLAEKKLPGTYRMIHHLSFPEGSSINDNIPQDKCSVQYASIEDAIELIKTVGRKSFCAKTDISSAFRIINIKESQYNLFGFMWEGKYYYDKNLQMGCSSSCQIFEIFSTALEWIAKNKILIPNIVHILDDF
ncbi:unnamed protein product [Mytilus coruscus]|uniref:Reverse transcriptase domain-containing protein n=1 Tax=Mytilus coruscus TaxID=42192 RepID=A0A6J8DAV3_MYTCO|nr:unnamed protein product [Mytilus coruscus]